MSNKENEEAEVEEFKKYAYGLGVFDLQSYYKCLRFYVDKGELLLKSTTFNPESTEALKLKIKSGKDLMYVFADFMNSYKCKSSEFVREIDEYTDYFTKIWGKDFEKIGTMNKKDSNE